MEEKMVRIPFDVELAKKIQAEKHPGKIMTRTGEDVRVLCFDAKNTYSIIALIKDKNGKEYPCSCKNNGCFYLNDSENNRDLMLEVPEWAQFKEGDVLVSKTGTIFIFEHIEYDKIYSYASLLTEFNRLHANAVHCIDYYSAIKGYATEDEKQKLINALKESKDDRAEEYLKRFFGIEPECKFKPFQQVLVRNTEEERWVATFFSHCNSSKLYPFHTTGDCSYTRCIPYNEGTKHLVGTTDNWEEES